MPSACVTAPAPSVRAEGLDRVDRELIDGCRAGDRAAMGALYQRYQRRVFSVLVRMVGRDDAEDLAQEVFVRIFRGVARFRGDSALGTWIYRLTVNHCLSFLAKRARRGKLDGQLAAEPEPVSPSPGNPWLRRQLEAALTELPPGYRAVLVLHDVEGLDHAEIAQILGCRVGTSKSQLHKARMRMRKLIQPADRGPEPPGVA